MGEPAESVVGLKKWTACQSLDRRPPSRLRSGPTRPLRLVRVPLGLRARPPATVLVRDRADELAVAVPAALADVALAAQPQGLPALLIEPLLSRGGLLGRPAVRGREAVGVSPRQ